MLVRIQPEEQGGSCPERRKIALAPFVSAVFLALGWAWRALTHYIRTHTWRTR